MGRYATLPWILVLDYDTYTYTPPHTPTRTPFPPPHPYPTCPYPSSEPRYSDTVLLPRNETRLDNQITTETLRSGCHGVWTLLRTGPLATYFSTSHPHYTAPPPQLFPSSSVRTGRLVNDFPSRQLFPLERPEPRGNRRGADVSDALEPPPPGLGGGGAGFLRPARATGPPPRKGGPVGGATRW